MVAFAIQIAAFLFLCCVGFYLLIAAVCAVGWVVAAVLAVWFLLKLGY